jgi:hypothetical protein
MEVYLGRAISDAEMHVLIAPRLKAGKLAEAGDDFVVAVRNSDAFGKATRDAAGGEFIGRHGIDIEKPTKKNKTEQDTLQTVETFAARESSRYAIVGFLATDENLTSTAGRRLFITVNGDKIPPGLYRFIKAGKSGLTARWRVISALPGHLSGRPTARFSPVGRAADTLLATIEHLTKVHRIIWTGGDDPNRVVLMIEGAKVLMASAASSCWRALGLCVRPGPIKSKSLSRNRSAMLLHGTTGGTTVADYLLMPTILATVPRQISTCWTSRL